jgi:DNA-binding response OmpR family regulator
VDGRVAVSEAPRVLVVDDCEISLLFHEYALAGGFRVLLARDGEEALRLICRERIDLVLLDLGLPDASGLDVLGELRGRDGAPPVVVLTVRGDAESRAQARERGCAGYLTKPVTVGELVRTVRRHLRN